MALVTTQALSETWAPCQAHGAAHACAHAHLTTGLHRTLPSIGRPPSGDTLSLCQARAEASIPILWRAGTSLRSALERLERDAATGGRFAKTFLGPLIWSKNTWCREIFVAHLEMSFVETPSDIRKQLELTASAKLTTKSVEDTFNALRGKRLKAKSNHIRRLSVWQRSMASRVLEDSGHRPLQAEPCDESSAPSRLPQGMFDSRKCEFSLGDSSLGEWRAGGWPSPSAENFVASGMRTAALVWSEGDSARLRLLEVSDAVPTGIVLTEADNMWNDSGWWLVLHATPWGVLAWPVDLRELHGQRFAFLRAMGERAAWRQLFIDSLDRFVGFDLSPTLPDSLGTIGHDDDDVSANVFSLRIEADEPSSILRLAAHRGFKHCDVSCMNNLINSAPALQAIRAPTLDEKRMAMMRYVLPDLSDSLLSLIAEFDGPLDATDYQTAMTKGDIEAANDILEHADQDEIEAVVAETKKKVEAAKKRAASAKERATSSSAAPADKPGAAPPDPAEAPTSAVDVEMQARPEPEPPSGAGEEPLVDALVAVEQPSRDEYTLAEARLLLPMAVGCTICIAEGNRWQGRYRSRPSQPRSHTETWGGAVSQADALRRVLVWLWAVHTDECGGDPCPFDLQDWD